MKGYTEIYLIPFINYFKQIRLNCRNCNIKNVKINGVLYIL